MSEIQKTNPHLSLAVTPKTPDNARYKLCEKTLIAAATIRTFNRIYGGTLLDSHKVEITEQLKPLIPLFFDDTNQETSSREEFFKKLIDHITTSTALDLIKRLQSLHIIETVMKGSDSPRKVETALFNSGLIRTP